MPDWRSGRAWRSGLLLSLAGCAAGGTAGRPGVEGEGEGEGGGDGGGAVVAGPHLVVSPEAMDFGAPPIGTTRTLELRLRNGGDEELRITGVAVAEDDDVSEFAAERSGALDLPIAPGEHLDLEVSYAPVDQGVDTGTLTVTSNDPASPAIEVSLTGTIADQPLARACVLLEPEAPPADDNCDSVFVFTAADTERDEVAHAVIYNAGSGDAPVTFLSAAVTDDTGFDGWLALEVYREVGDPPVEEPVAGEVALLPGGDAVRLRLTFDPHVPSYVPGEAVRIQTDRGPIDVPICLEGFTGGETFDCAPRPPERCNDVDDNLDGRVDEGCNDDHDFFCDAEALVDGTPETCPLGGGDCNDEVVYVSPLGIELCDGVDEDCDGEIDEGCDDDGDGYCDGAMDLFGAPARCPLGGGDCDDGDPDVHPGLPDYCDGVDTDCDGAVDDEAGGITALALPAPGQTTTVTGDLAGLPDVADPCGEAGPEQWFTITLPEPDIVELDTFGSGLDTVLSLLEGSCGGPRAACNTDACGTPQSALAAALPAGTHYVAVEAAAGAAPGAFTLQFTRAGSARGQPLELPVGGTATIAGNSCGAGNQNTSAICASAAGEDVSFFFPGCPARLLTAQTCGSNFDTVLLVSSGTLAAQIACHDDTPACPTPNGCFFGSSLTALIPDRGLYFITVDAFWASGACSCGDYTLGYGYF